jgi:hypothetical protein
MTSTEAHSLAEALRVKALALYAEAKILRGGPSWRDSVQRELTAKLDEAKAIDHAYNDAVFEAMRIETEERRRARAA